jgi:large subunit ribosomal protein L21
MAEKAFAIIETGGQQYLVSPGEKVKIEKISGDYSEGSPVTFDKVLMVDDGSTTTLGEPYIKGATVEGEVKKIGRAKKVIVIKYKAKSRYFKKRGHRQPFFEVKINKI